MQYIRFDRLPEHVQNKINQRAKEEGISREETIARFVSRAIGENGLKRIMADMDKELDKVPRLQLVQGRKKDSERAS